MGPEGGAAPWHFDLGNWDKGKSWDPDFIVNFHSKTYEMRPEWLPEVRRGVASYEWCLVFFF